MADLQRINLIPDIKKERIKQQRKEQLTRLVAWGVIGGMGALTLLMVSAAVFQWRSLVSTQESIEREQAAIESIENKDELVGMQTALEELPELSRQKVFVSQLPNIMENVVPNNVTLTFMGYSTGGDIELTGKTDSYRSLYTFVDALENVEGTPSINGEEGESSQFFTNVEYQESTGGEEITFSVSATLDESFIALSGNSLGGVDDGLDDLGEIDEVENE